MNKRKKRKKMFPPEGDVAHNTEDKQQKQNNHIQAEYNYEPTVRKEQASRSTTKQNKKYPPGSRSSLWYEQHVQGLVPCYHVCPLIPAFVNQCPPPERVRQATQINKTGSSSTHETRLPFRRTGWKQDEMYKKQYKLPQGSRSTINNLSYQTKWQKWYTSVFFCHFTVQKFQNRKSGYTKRKSDYFF